MVNRKATVLVLGLEIGGSGSEQTMKVGGDQQKMNRSRAAILKAADAVSGGERTAERSAFQMCE